MIGLKIPPLGIKELRNVQSSTNFSMPFKVWIGWKLFVSGTLMHRM